MKRMMYRMYKKIPTPVSYGPIGTVPWYGRVLNLCIQYPNEGRMQLDSSVELHGKY